MMKLKIIFLLTSLCTMLNMTSSDRSHGCLESKLRSQTKLSTATDVPAPAVANTMQTETAESLIANVEKTVSNQTPETCSKAAYNTWTFSGGSHTDYFLARSIDDSLRATLEIDYDLAQQICNNSFTIQMKRDIEELCKEERQMKLQASANVVKKYSKTKTSQTLETITSSTPKNTLSIYPHQLPNYNTKQQAVLKKIFDKSIEQLKNLDAQHAAGVDALFCTTKRAAENKQFFHEQHEITKPKDSNDSYYNELQDPKIYETAKSFEDKLRSMIKASTENK